ncbi:MAG: TraG domain-containing protein, partial [Chromatiaceae bacterium]
MAGEIAKRVTRDAGFDARLAESVKADSQSGRRNIFSERLSSEESARLGKEAGDVVSASRSLERDQSMARRYGAMGTFGAAEIGHAIASDPQRMARLYREIDQRHLTGDLQRLSSSWAYARNLGRDEADAAAGVALLIGHAEGRTSSTFTPAEEQGAKEAGYSILADTFATHRPGSELDPYRNAGLESAAPSQGSVRAAVEGGALRDPRTQVSGLGDELRAHGQLVDSQYDPSAADRFYAERQGTVADRHQEQQERVRSEKRDHLGALIEQRAVLPRPSAQVARNEVGGLFVQMAVSGDLLRA